MPAFKPTCSAHLIFLNLGGKALLNEPEIYEFFQNSSLIYLKPRLDAERWQIFALTAGVINFADFDLRLSENFSSFARPSLLFSIAGDSMRIHGEDNSRYEFKAHRFGGETGLRYRFFGEEKFLMLQAFFQFESNHIFNRPEASVFPMPKSFQTYSLGLQLGSSRSAPPTELFEFGVFPLLYFAYNSRSDFAEFASPKQSEIPHSLATSAGLRVALPFHPDAVGVTEIQSFWIYPADRFNAARPSGLRSRSLDLFFKDVKSDRAIAGELGVRFYFNSEKTIAIRPFVFSALYNQLLLPGETEKKGLISGGFKLMGRWTPRVFYDALYALGYGNRPDLGIQHEIRFNVGIRLFGEPPPRRAPRV
jgi:hypothetical protein